jgi:hypothetical protein
MFKTFTHKSIKNANIVFVIKLLVFCALIILLDYGVGSVLRYFYFKQDSGLQYRTTYSIEKTTADVLIFGSSKANHHYHPAVFEERLQLPYYNAGRDGNAVFYHYAVLKAVLKRYTPKMVVLDFVNGEFKQGQESYDRLSSLLPYYKTHPEIRPLVELKSDYEKFKLLSSIYPFNSSLFTIAVGNTEFNKKRTEDIKGYVPLSRVWNGPVKKENNPVTYLTDSLKIKAYETFIQDCLNAKIKLYVVVSPYFIQSATTDYSVTIAQQIANKYQVPFLDYSKDSAFITQPALFADIDHLNDEGAKVFSNRLIDGIIKMK